MENYFAFAHHGERVLALLRVASHVTSVKRLYNASLSPTYLPTYRLLLDTTLIPQHAPLHPPHSTRLADVGDDRIGPLFGARQLGMSIVRTSAVSTVPSRLSRPPSCFAPRIAWRYS